MAKTGYNKKHKKRILGFLFSFLLLLPMLQALSLSGKLLSPITYRPGETIVNNYLITGAKSPVEVMIDNSTFHNLSVSEISSDEFDLILNFPEKEYIAPGSYSFGLSVREKQNSSDAGISTLVAVSRVFQVMVYSYEKEIQVSLSVPNINEGGEASFVLTVTSLGYPDINAVQGDVTFYDAQNNLLGKVSTPIQSLKGLESLSFTGSLDTNALPASNYWARAVVWYDGKEKSANATFLIGNMDILIGNYTSVFQPGFNEFMILVKNNWGNMLRNVYAKLLVQDKELIQTPSLNLEPWQEDTLKGIVKIDLEPGTYPGLLKIFFEGEVKEVPVSITVVNPSSEETTKNESVSQPAGKSSAGIIFTVISALVLVLILVYLLMRRGKKGGFKKDEF